MSPAHVLEPTYAAIKQRLLEGAWAPGTRLESARIADMVGVSMTPVRDSLNRLVGESLVDLRPGFGFHVPQLGAVDLRELLELNLGLLHLAIARRTADWRRVPQKDPRDHGRETRNLFGHLARCARSQALENAVAAMNDRLHATRLVEHRVLDEDPQAELARLRRICAEGEVRELGRWLRQYHHRRFVAAPRLTALLVRGQGGSL